MTQVGYARTSTLDQCAGLAAQVKELKAAGCTKLFDEQVSSMTKRPALAECLKWLREGDVLMVTKPDRLARNTEELLTIVKDLTARDIGLIVLSMGGQRLDTRDATATLMLTILAGVATWERAIMLERQRTGIQAAKLAGRYKGRTPTVMAQADTIRQMYADGAKPLHIARDLGIARSSVYRVLHPEGAIEPPAPEPVTPPPAKPKARGKAR